MRAIQGFHMDVRGYSDIGYAYVVFQPYGELERARVLLGRLLRWVPAAQAGHNTGTIPVSVFGNFQRDDGVKEATLDAIVALLTKSASKTGCGSAKTIGGTRERGRHSLSRRDAVHEGRGARDPDGSAHVQAVLTTAGPR